MRQQIALVAWTMVLLLVVLQSCKSKPTPDGFAWLMDPTFEASEVEELVDVKSRGCSDLKMSLLAEGASRPIRWCGVSERYYSVRVSRPSNGGALFANLSDRVSASLGEGTTVTDDAARRGAGEVHRRVRVWWSEKAAYELKHDKWAQGEFVALVVRPRVLPKKTTTVDGIPLGLPLVDVKQRFTGLKDSPCKNVCDPETSCDKLCFSSTERRCGVSVKRTIELKSGRVAVVHFESDPSTTSGSGAVGEHPCAAELNDEFGAVRIAETMREKGRDATYRRWEKGALGAVVTTSPSTFHLRKGFRFNLPPAPSERE